VKKQIAQKQNEYDNLMKNLSAATFTPEIIQDLNNRMKALKAEIETLATAEPPEEYSTNTILEWLKAIKAAPDQRAVHLLIERVDVSSDQEKTDVNVISTLTSVGELVAAIRYGILSDCNDSGKDAENSAALRYRTDALRPFSLSRHDQTKRPPIGGLLYGSGDPIRHPFGLHRQRKGCRELRFASLPNGRFAPVLAVPSRPNKKTTHR